MNPPPFPSRPTPSDILFLGLNSSVVALDKRTGGELWRVPLKAGLSSGHPFVSLLLDGDILYAHTRGEAFAIHALNGRLLWRNELPGLGYGLASLAVKGASSVPAVAEQQVSDARNSQMDSSSAGA